MKKYKYLSWINSGTHIYKSEHYLIIKNSGATLDRLTHEENHDGFKPHTHGPTYWCIIIITVKMLQNIHYMFINKHTSLEGYTYRKRPVVTSETWNYCDCPSLTPF